MTFRSFILFFRSPERLRQIFSILFSFNFLSELLQVYHIKTEFRFDVGSKE